MRRHLNTVKNNANATAEFSTQSKAHCIIKLNCCRGSQIMKGAHKRYHKLCWLWCYPSLFRNRDTEWMDHDQRQRVSCAMGRESPLLSPPTCRWSHAPSS
uniref:Uncharacterized protein n=2 Tax=Oryza glumipatula TaxID=40148 RepID=A0A0D9Y9U1_9ORYZ